MYGRTMTNTVGGIANQYSGVDSTSNMCRLNAGLNLNTPIKMKTVMKRQAKIMTNIRTALFQSLMF